MPGAPGLKGERGLVGLLGRSGLDGEKGDRGISGMPGESFSKVYKLIIVNKQCQTVLILKPKELFYNK